MEIDLKLHGDKIKLETRPASTRECSSASYKSAYLAKGPARPVSAVPMLSLYNSKDDYDVSVASSLRPYSADHLPKRNKLMKELTLSDLSGRLPSSILHEAITSSNAPQSQSWQGPEEKKQQHEQQQQTQQHKRESVACSSAGDTLKLDAKLIHNAIRSHRANSELTPGLKTKPPPIPKPTRTNNTASNNGNVGGMGACALGLLIKTDDSICDEDKQTDLIYMNRKPLLDDGDSKTTTATLETNASDLEKCVVQQLLASDDSVASYDIGQMQQGVQTEKNDDSEMSMVVPEGVEMRRNVDVLTFLSSLEDGDDFEAILKVLAQEMEKSKNQIESIKSIVNDELSAFINTPNVRMIDDGPIISEVISIDKPSANEIELATIDFQSIISFLDEVEQANSKVLIDAQNRLEKISDSLVSSSFSFDTLPKVDDLLIQPKHELSTKIIELNLRLKEKSSAIKTLQDELHNVREHVMGMVRKQDAKLHDRLRNEKHAHQSVIKRHQKFIDQLISEKKSLSDRCESFVYEMRVMEERFSSNMKAVEHRHQVEMQKMKDMIMISEKQRRDKWMTTKTKQIKDLTVKSLEPELEALTIRHENAMAELRALHKKEIEDIELKNSRKLHQHLEDQRQRMIEEREKYVAHERDALRSRYETLIATEEKSYQEQKRRLQAEHDKRLKEFEERLSLANDERERAVKQVQRESEERIQTLIKQHESIVQAEKDKAKCELEAFKGSWRMQQEADLLNKEEKIRSKCRKDRDREIENIIERLEKEANEIKIQNDAVHEKRLRRLKEKYDKEISDLELSEKECQAKYMEVKERLLDADETIAELRASVKHFECEWRKTNELYEKLLNEKSTLKESLRKEMRSEITVLEKEIGRIKSDRDIELQQVYGRVKLVIARKDEMLKELKEENISLKEKCSCLESMLEQQRSEYLIKYL